MKNEEMVEELEIVEVEKEDKLSNLKKIILLNQKCNLILDIIRKKKAERSS